MYIILDTLSRLASSNNAYLPDNYLELDSLFYYIALYIRILEAFRKRLLNRYEEDLTTI